jgi:hypothetical protein
LAIQIISRLRQTLGCDIPVRLLFDHPTVAALDAALEATLGADMDELLDRIETMPDAEVEALLQKRRRALDSCRSAAHYMAAYP